MSSFGFDPKGLQQAAESGALQDVTLDDAQRRLVQDLGNLVAPLLGIDSIPSRGLWLQAVRAWQVHHGQFANTITQATPAERLKAAIEIKDRFRDLAASILLDPQQKVMLDEVVERAYQLYIAKYNKR